MAKNKIFLFFLTFFIIETFLIFTVTTSFIPLVSGNNETVNGTLEVGESYPTILNVSLENGNADVTLLPATTKTVFCEARIVDFNGDNSLSNVKGVLYDSSASNLGAADDKNDHYTNSSCEIIESFTTWNGHADDEYHVLANCTFEVEYYANPSAWNCAINVTDNATLSDEMDAGDSVNILELLGISLPDSINYGTVNATYVSDEQVLNVENVGNVMTDIRVSAYAHTPGDGLAMNCSLGLEKNITLDYEKYNVSVSNGGALSLSEFESSYKNVTALEVLETINLNYRQDDVSTDAINPTYWRIYVPRGVAGTCSGNIVFGAVKS